MTSIIKVDDVQDAAGNNIIREAGDTITIGASGDTITIPSGATITNSGTATGFGGGKVINHYSGVLLTALSITSTTTTVLQSPNITPVSTSSKFIITPTTNWSSTNPNGAIFVFREIAGYNDLDPVQSISGSFGTVGNVKDLDEPGVPNNYAMETWSQTFVDSPNTTSLLNYTLRVSGGSATVYINRANADANYEAVTTISILELDS